MANLQISVQTDYNGRGIRQAQADMQDLSNKTIQQLKDRLKGLQTTLDNIRPNSAQFTRYSQELAKTAAQLQAVQRAARSGGAVLQTSMGGATSSVIEFNRVIQDAPFGIQGVGNNIQALTQNLAYLTTQTGSARKATSVFFSTLVTPANLAVLAISAITTAWTIYARQQQSAAKETKGQVSEIQKYNQGLSDFIDTQDATSRATSSAAKSTSEEITKLQVLYGITQDVTMSLKNRNRAVDQIQKLYPAYFANQTNEAILTGNASAAYDELSKKIEATGLAMAAVNIKAKNFEQLVDIGLRTAKANRENNDLLEQRAIIETKIAALRASQKKDPNARDQFSAQNIQVNSLYKKQAEIDKQLGANTDQRLEDFKKEVSLKKEQYDLQALINKEVKSGADLTGKPGAAYNDKTINLGNDVIKDSLSDSASKAALESLDGVKEKLEKLRQEYKGYYDAIDNYVSASIKKGVDYSKQAESAKTQLSKDENSRRVQIETEEAQRVSSEVQRIRDASGVASEQTMEKEYASLVQWYDAEVKKAAGNADILAAIEESTQARRDAIRQKYYDKYADAVDKLTKKIQAIEEQPFAQNRTGLADETKKLQQEIDKRIKKVNEYYDSLQKLNQDGTIGSAVIYGLRAASTAGIKKSGSGAQDATDSLSAKALNAAVGKFTSDMFDSIAHIGDKNNEISEKYNKARENATDAEIIKLNELEKREKAIVNSFGSIFSSIFDSLNNAMQSLFKTTLSNLLKTSFSKGLEDLNFGGLGSKISGAIVAGAGLAGAALSSIGGGKNSVTSAAGGALSGAASGAVLGSAVPGIGTVAGAIGGAVIGAIGGLFGSSAKRKQEELEKQQLEEQKKTNAILDRQSKLAYSSQIVGRMSDRGVITGVDINEFGQLTTTISGNDIVVSYDRTKKKNDRGV